MEGYSWLPATAHQQPPSSGTSAHLCLLWTKIPPLKLELREAKANIEESIWCKKSLIPVKDLFKIPRSARITAAALGWAAHQAPRAAATRRHQHRGVQSHQGIFNSSAQSRNRVSTSPASVSAATWFMFCQSTTTSILLSDRTLKIFSCEAKCYCTHIYALPSCSILLPFSLLEPWQSSCFSKKGSPESHTSWKLLVLKAF